jgi:hypothetical protein
MRYKELLKESQKLPGAARGIKIMSPQEFVAGAQEKEVEEEARSGESTHWRVEQSEATGRYHVVTGYQKRKVWKNKLGACDFNSKDSAQKKADELNQKRDVTEDLHLDEGITDFILKAKDKFLRLKDALSDEWAQSKQMWQIVKKGNEASTKEINFANNQFKDILKMVGLGSWYTLPIPGNTLLILTTEKLLNRYGMTIMPDKIKNQVLNVKKQGVTEGSEDTAAKRQAERDKQRTTPAKKARNQAQRKGLKQDKDGTYYAKEGVAEATKLPASTRELKGQELQDYLNRIVDKEKKKTDKYKLPYIHRKDVVSYYSADGNQYDPELIKQALAQRPKELLKKNEKMKHSDGTTEQFFNIGFAALVGLALDETTNELIVVNTCPGAGSCKIDCFAMKGGKVQFQGPWLSDSRILTYLLNDPDGFFNQLKTEISAQVAKGNKKGYKVSIRWHDAGDFFSPEYVGMAFKLASELPMVDFYAYTKIADVALAQKPDNFMINWSEGAHPSQERKVKAQDPELEHTKNSRIVPSKLFYDLLVKDEDKNLVKGPAGQWQVIPEKLPELKQRLAKEYGISSSSILSYSEWDTRGRRNPTMKWNVIIAPGEPDLTAKDPGVLSTLLLKH